MAAEIKQLESTKYWDGLDVEITYERDSTAGDRLIIRDGMVSASSVRMKMNDFLKDVADGGSIQ